MHSATRKVNSSKLAKILLVSQLPPPFNGSTIMTRTLVSALRLSGHDVFLVNKSFSRQSDEIGKAYFRKLLGLPAFLIRFIFGIFDHRPKVMLLFLTNRPQSFLVDCCVLAISRIFRVRIICYLHTNGFSELAARNVIFRELVKWAFKSSNLTVTLSKSMTEDVMPFVQVDRTRIIRNCTVDSQSPERADALSRFNHKKIIFVSNLIPSKGYVDFLRLFYALSDEFKELSGVLIGSPTYRDQLEHLRSEVHSAGFSSTLKILGYQDHETISKYLSESSVFVFPSQYAFEAQPLVLLEALAHSLPIVGYSSGQISEMISRESGSRLVAPGDLEQLQLEVKALLSNLDSWTSASELALIAFNKDFSADVYRINWQEAINEVV